MKFSASTFRETRWQRYLPIGLPWIVLALQIVGNPDYTLFSLPSDLVFAAVSFDVWALQTIFSRRMVSFGGLFDFPSGEPGGSRCMGWEGARWGIVFFVHLVLVFLLAKRPLTHPEVFLGISFFAGTWLPLCLLRGDYLPKEFYEALRAK